MASHKCCKFQPCSSGWTRLRLVCVVCALGIFWKNTGAQGLLKMDSALRGPWLIVYDIVFNLFTAERLSPRLWPTQNEVFLSRQHFSSCNSLIFIVVAYHTFWVPSSHLILPCKVDFTGCVAILSAIPNLCKTASQYITSQEEEREI